MSSTTTNSQPFFSCRELNAFYGESYVVQGVSFDIPEGEIVALLGRNGAGKTSTLRAIARANQPAIIPVGIATAINKAVTVAAKGQVHGKIHAITTSAANMIKNLIIISSIAPKDDLRAR